MIKAIIFDCFGVLTTDLWKEFVATLPEEQKQPARDLNHAYDAGFLSENDFIRQVQQLTGKNPGEVENLKASEIDKNTQLLDYIKELKSRYKIGLLSNIASGWIRESFLSEQEQALFDSMTMSYEVKLTKPNPEIFRIACEKLGVKPDEALVVDDINHYCEAARSIGMQAVVYENFTQMKNELEQLLADSDN